MKCLVPSSRVIYTSKICFTEHFLFATQCAGMAASRHSSDELPPPPPYSSVVDDAYVQGFPHPPGYVRVDNAGHETATNSSSAAGQNETEPQVRFVLVPIDKVLALYEASNANASAQSSQNDASSHQNCSEYTPDVERPPAQRRTVENYIDISKGLSAATQSGDSSPAVRFTQSNRALAATQSGYSSPAVRFTQSPPNGNNINISNRVLDDTEFSRDEGDCSFEDWYYACRYLYPYIIGFCVMTLVIIGIFVRIFN